MTRLDHWLKGLLDSMKTESSGYTEVDPPSSFEAYRKSRYVWYMFLAFFIGLFIWGAAHALLDSTLFGR